MLAEPATVAQFAEEINAGTDRQVIEYAVEHTVIH